jgi:hypothetical protein
MSSQATSKHSLIHLRGATRAVLGLVILGVIAYSPVSLRAATISLDVYGFTGVPGYPAQLIASPTGTTLSGGTAYVGAFMNGSLELQKTDIAALWNNTKAGFDAIWARFVNVASATVNLGAVNVSASPDTRNVSGKNLVGKSVYILVVDNSSAPTSFLLLATDGAGSPSGAGYKFADPIADTNDPFAETSTTVEVIAEAYQFTVGSDTTIVDPTTTTVVGSYNALTDKWTMASIPASASIALIGNGSVVHYWGTTYVDAGATQSVTPVIKDISSYPATITDFATMSGKLGTYTVAYTSGGTTVTRTVTVKLLNPSADDDKDGLSNLLEYVLGGTQGSNDSAKLPVISIVGSEVLLTFTARSDITPTSDVALSFLTTTTLSSAFQQEVLTKKSSVNQTGIPIGYEKQQWVIASTTTPKKFARLQTSVSSALSSGV